MDKQLNRIPPVLVRLALILVLFLFLRGIYASASARDVDMADIRSAMLQNTDMGKMKECNNRKLMQFMGINFREDPARGAAFEKKAGITYPSLTDESGVLILELQGKAPTVPTTLVLDRDGRIASRVNGPVSASTLRALVEDAVAESSPTASPS